MKNKAPDFAPPGNLWETLAAPTPQQQLKREYNDLQSRPNLALEKWGPVFDAMTQEDLARRDRFQIVIERFAALAPKVKDDPDRGR